LSPSTERIAELVAEVGRATDERAWSQAFRLGFGRLGRELQLHPAGSRASATFASAAATARAVGADCLPLGIALVMHLYPLCALRCVPLPWWSAAHRRRAWLLHAVDRHALILANAGSERAAGAHEPVKLSRTRDGIRIEGTYDYVSLAHVADVVLFSAPLASEGKVLFCAADPRADSVTLGANRFGGSMRLSDTCSVTFAIIGYRRIATSRFRAIPRCNAWRNISGAGSSCCSVRLIWRASKGCTSNGICRARSSNARASTSWLSSVNTHCDCSTTPPLREPCSPSPGSRRR
jgi:alkylation response protein AidB-like acyl-CoA dehydrogenase